MPEPRAAASLLSAAPARAAEGARAVLPLTARALVYRAGGRALVDGLDLTLEAGGVTMIMGPNGAGKSLLLRLLHGLLPPSGGTVRCAGEPLGLAHRRRQALVFQKPVLLRRSVLANLEFVLRARPDAARRDARELLAHVGLLELAAQPARALSGGEQQRLALARALATEPALLLLDEPTASLDPAATARIEAIVRLTAETGTKVVFVSHDIGQARRLASEVVFLHRGRVLEHAPAATFFDHPRSTAARDYLAGHLLT